MKVTIPVDEPSPTSPSAHPSAGRRTALCEDGGGPLHRKSGAWAQGGAGLKSRPGRRGQRGQALVTVRCGGNAAQVLKAAGMAIYKGRSGSAPR